MFDLITGNIERPLRRRSVGSRIIAMVAHVVIILVLVVAPLLLITNQMPAVAPTMKVFVSAPTPPPPPPPPPGPAPARQLKAVEPVPTSGQFAAPIAAPTTIEPERTSARNDPAGVLGGVEGGIPGGVVGGIVGGIVSAVPPPPPPPAPPEATPPRGPVRIGGQITAPALIHRVEPEYPEIASHAQLSGIVILEAVVDTDGCVQSVKVLRSRHPLLDTASEQALMRWRYSPLVLNGIPTPFVLTVTFNFSVKR
jgi:protein TonB